MFKVFRQKSKTPKVESSSLSTMAVSQNPEKDELSLPVEERVQKDSSTGEEEEDYISGLKLVLVMISITLVIFLTSLDMTIIATV